jgi:ABC-type Fe3+/spermidine/putrescine transport system ATPase subunit
MIAVALAGLRKAFGGHDVFAGLELTVLERETLAILGPSGSGKSTLLRCIAGLETPDEGSVAVNGEVGYVFQEPRLFPWLDVEGNVAFAARTPQERARVAEVIELVGLTGAAKRLPKQLSGGMAQRAGWPARSCATRRFSCSTSRSRRSTRSKGSNSRRRFATSFGSRTRPRSW